MENLNHRIQDYFELPDLGVVISIANPTLDKLSNNAIKDLISNRIAIVNSDTQKQKRIEVSDIDIATSIIDKKNVHICLGNSIKLSEIKPNSDLVLANKILF